MGRVVRIVLAFALGVLALALPGVPATAADPTADLQINKSVDDPGPYGPGDTFSYTIEVGCSSTNTAGCANTVLSDTLPAPLILDPDATPNVAVALSPSGTATVTRNGDDEFTVTPQQDVAGTPGLISGGTMTVTVNVKVPDDISADFDGQTARNTASVVADNADVQSSSADVTFNVDTTLVADVDKTVAPGTVPANPGRNVTWTVNPTNASNQTTDTLVVEDTFDGTNQQYLDFTSVVTTPEPATTTSTDVEYLVGGTWTTTAPTDPADVDGVRVTYHGSYPPDATGTVTINTVTNDDVETIPNGTVLPVTNTAEATTSKGGDTSAPADDSATTNLSRNDPDVTVTKAFDDSTLTVGEETVAHVVATVGAQDVHELTINEPSDGSPNFVDQGLIFTGFGDSLAWPLDAESASITYSYSDCADSTESTEAKDTLPDPTPGCTVSGFSVTFTAAPGTDGIQAGSYADLPIEVTATTDITSTTTSTNEVDTTVTNTDGDTGTADASDTFTIRPLEVHTETDKSISPSEIPALPGASAVVSLPSKVTPDPDSTIGSDHLIISDPATPPGPPSAFFTTYFTVTDIRNTDIPACASLTVNYWSVAQSTWVPLAGPVAGPQTNWSTTVPSGIQPDIGGIQFDFEPLTGGDCTGTLPPGFNVIPNFGIQLKPGIDPDTDVTLTNTSQSDVNNASIDQGDTDRATDDIHVRPVDDGGGPGGVNLVGKTWLQDDVPALSGNTRTARISWTTGGLDFQQMVITDPASATELSNVATSVFDAFNLARVQPITPATDPLIANDRVSKVELYLSGTWTDVTAQACSSAAACTGTFPGLALNSTQQQNATGVRLTFAGSTAGASLSPSYDDRPIDLDFVLRDTLRSTGAYALGNFHDYTYNTGDPGLVDNSVGAEASGGLSGTRTDTADDTILIIDAPLNVSTTKTFDQDVLGLPGPLVDEADYPLIDADLTATNTSAAKISSLSISDPSPAQPDPTAFDVLDLVGIAGITPPGGLSNSDVTVVLNRGGATQSYGYAAALALTPADLADVTGITITAKSATNAPVILSGGQLAADLVFRLRKTKRSGGLVQITQPGGDPIENVIETTGDSPGRIVCPAVGCSPGTATADDEFNIVLATYDITTSKSIDPTSRYVDETPTYTTSLRGRPGGTARTTLFTLTDDTDTFWNVMNFNGATMAVPAPINSVRMDAKVGSTWIDGTWEATSPGTPFVFLLPTGVDPLDVVGVRFSFQVLSADGTVLQWERPFNPQLNVSLRTIRRDTQRGNGEPVSTTEPGQAPNEGETSPGLISDEVVANAHGQFGPRPEQGFDREERASATTLVKHRVNAIKVTKGPGNATTPPRYSPAGTVPYVFTVENTGDWPITGMTLQDTFDLVNGASPVVEPTPPAYTFTLTSSNSTYPAPTPTPAFSADFDEATATLTVTMPPGPPDFVFYPGWKLTVNAPMRFAPGLSPNEIVHNTVAVDSDRNFEKCDYTTNTVAQPTQPNVATCSATTNVEPLAAATLSMVKSVKGNGAGEPGGSRDDLGVLNVGGNPTQCQAPDAAGFYKAPCLPITRPGGVETWRLSLTNNGNANAKIIALVDTLPAVNDRGVITSAARGSEFGVRLRNAFDSNIEDRFFSAASVTAYYSTARLSTACNNNAMRVHTANEAPDPACAFNWTAYSSATDNADLAAAQSVKFVVDWGAINGAGLRPNETLDFVFDTTTPAYVPKASGFANPLPVAYNSFAGSSRVVATLNQPERAELSLEPTKVGIATAFGQATIAKVVDPPDFSQPVTLPSSYTFDVSCLSAGSAVPVPLVNSTGTPVTTVTVTMSGDTGSATLNAAGAPVNVPLFADCTFTENPVPPGATVVYSPSDQVRADGNLATISTVVNPYQGSPSTARVTATNSFSDGGFTVTKTVDNGGAIDQNGQPIVYDQEFPFRATCSYLGEVFLDETFSLSNGESKEYVDFPTGAECSVEETDSGLATATLTIDGDPAANPAEFTIGDSTTDDPVAVVATNTFTVGSVTVTKTVTGDGAVPWGLNPFTVRMICTLPTADPNIVYTAEHVFQPPLPANLTWTVSNLPTGASCTLTEPGTGGANDTAITPNPVIVGSGTTATVDITNTFETGSVEARKVLLGPGSQFPPISNGTYVLSLTCTREVNGATIPVPIPGGAERTVTGAGTVTWDGLPTGAECVVSETSSTPESQGVVYLPDGGDVIVPGSGAAASVVRVANYFGVGYLQITKLLTGPGVGLPPFEPLTFQATCALESVTLLDETITLTPQQGDTSLSSDVLGPLPVGTTCEVIETDSGDADATDAPVTVVITEGTETTPVVATITNTYGAGTVSITKVLGGKFAEEDLLTTFRFPITVTCQLEYVDATGATVRGTVLSQNITVRADKTKVVTGADGKPALVPTGSHCWAEETDPMGASKVVITNNDYETGAVVPKGTGTANLDIVVKNIYNDGSDLFPLTDEDGSGADALGGTGSPLPQPLIWAAVGSVVAGLVMVVAAWRRRRQA